MKFLWLIYKQDLLFIYLISSLFLWASVTSYLAFQNKTQVILIGKAGNSYQLITDEKKDPIETGNFIRYFLALTLNFDEGSYKKHISLAGDLMTEGLWNKKKPEFKEMAGFIKKHKVIQSSKVLSIKKIKTSQYEVTIKNYLFKKGVLTEKTKLVLLALTNNKRSFENPWRYSVSDIEVK